MNIEKIKVEAEFRTICDFEPFQYLGLLYLKLPAITCQRPSVSMSGRTEWFTGDFNAVRIDNPRLADYAYFKDTALVKPLKADLRIYE